VTENRAIKGILLFLGATKNSKEVLQAFGRNMVLEKPICIAAISQAFFI
jgi:hypothetical protein